MMVISVKMGNKLKGAIAKTVYNSFNSVKYIKATCLVLGTGNAIPLPYSYPHCGIRWGGGGGGF